MWLALVSHLISAAAFAAEPTLTHLYPVAGQQGRTIAVAVAGKFEPWPPRVWIDAGGVTVTATPIIGTFNVDIAADAAPGPHLVRLINEQGASAPRFFIVSREPELRDAEPNDDFRSPQQITAMPATISGRLDKTGDVECFAVALKQGQTLVAWVEAYVLGSTCDALLRIADTSGRVLAFNHDGRNLDPFLTWSAPIDGTFIVQLMAFAHPATSTVQLAGGEGCVYRLHLTGDPFVRYTRPLAVQRGQKAALELIGWNLAAKQTEVDTSGIGASVNVAELPRESCLAAEPLVISDHPETVETEPNNTADIAQAFPVPSAVTGSIGGANDEDRYAFAAVKSRVYELRLTGSPVASPLDAWLKIEGNDGKELARNDDAAGSRDPQLTWTAPADGIVAIAVGDVTHRGGDDFVYRLAIREAAPSVTATAASHSVLVPAGKTAELKVAIKRAHGFKAGLQLTPKNLPAGVSAPAVEVPEKDGEVTLKLTAESSAMPAGQPFALTLRETESGREHPVLFRLVSTSEDNGVPQGYSELVIDATDQLWITVTSEPPK